MTLILKKFLFEIFQNKKNEKKNQLLESPAVSDEKETHVAVVALAGPRAPCCSRYMKTFIAACVLLLLSMLAIGGYYIYRQRMDKENRARCFVGYVDMQFDPNNVRRIEEEAQVSLLYQYEKLKVPSFDECRAAVVMHDFSKRYSAIVDMDHLRCFIWPLNTTQILAPSSFWDMVMKISGGYYMPDLAVVRDDYRVLPARLTDLTPYGPYIRDECLFFNSYALQRIQYTGFVKRASDHVEHYGEVANTRTVQKYQLFIPGDLV